MAVSPDKEQNQAKEPHQKAMVPSSVTPVESVNIDVGEQKTVREQGAYMTIGIGLGVAAVAGLSAGIGVGLAQRNRHDEDRPHGLFHALFS